MSLDLLFGNDSSASAAAGSSYERDVFIDVTLPADSNSGLTSNASTNPLSASLGNCDTQVFQKKTLLIKGISLIEDRTKWISQRPTYQIVFTETFPAVTAYAFGSFTTENLGNAAKFGDQFSPFEAAKYLKFSQVNDGIGVTGKIRRLQWLVQGDTSSTATAMRATDGSNTSTISFGNVAANSDASGYAKFAAYVHQTSNETNDLHDFRLLAQQQNTLKVLGVVVYFENTGANIEVFPGKTYVDKTKVTTTAGATFSVPTFGSSMGGVFAALKTQAGGYSLSTQGWSPITSIAIGSSGSNILAVTAGTGSSFLPGMGVVVNSGTSFYVGNVQSISTDSLTVFPTLAFGLSNAIYNSWLAGPTYAISQTMMSLRQSIGVSNLTGFSGSMLDPSGRYAIWGTNFGTTLSFDNKVGIAFKGSSGFLQIEGYFQAADMELLSGGSGIFGATISVNGLPAWSEAAGVTGAFRRTLFTNGGNGWNSVVIAPGASLGAVMISGINLYTSQPKTGITYGVLSFQRVNQAQVPRAAHNATMFSLGMQRRVFADQLMLTGNWVRGVTFTAAGGAIYYGISSNCAVDFQYYGKDLAILGTLPSSATLTIDSIGYGLSMGMAIGVTNYGFHTVRITTGATATIQAVDFFNNYDEPRNTQNVLGQTVEKDIGGIKKIFERYGAGTYYFSPPAGCNGIVVSAAGGGGGGARASLGSASTSSSGGGGGGSGVLNAFVPLLMAGTYTVTIGAGGAGGSSNATAGTDGGATTITDPAGNVIFYVAGGTGGAVGTTTSGGAGGAGSGMGGAGGAGNGTSSGGQSLSGSNGSRATFGAIYSGGTGGAGSGSDTAGGGGGGGGIFGTGGNGGQYNTTTPSTVGYSAGGGGGGGGGGGTPTMNGATGGDGGVIIYQIKDELRPFESLTRVY